jgi:hypothetical protein
MLRAHSLLWYYLWVAPNLLLFVLAFLLGRRGLHKRYPFFFAFLIISAVDQLILYIADLSPAISPQTWWLIFWFALIVESVLKFALIGEVFFHAFHAYRSVANLGKLLIRGLGVVLILAAALAAAYAPHDSLFGIVSGAHLLEQTVYLVETGLLAFIFVFSGYFKLSLARPVLGIAAGLSISACVHLATWAVLANGGLSDEKRVWLDFVNMATFHVCVLIWFYYLLVPLRVSAKPAVPLPENNLAVWNRELERLLQQ